MAGSRGVGGAVADMGRSLGLVLLVVVVLLLLTPARRLVWQSGSSTVHTVSYADDVKAARYFAKRPVPAPTGLDAKWRATSARVDGGNGDPTVLHIGFVTPREQYAGLDESDGTPMPFLEQQLGRSGAHQVDGTVVIDGAQWRLRRDAKGEPALTTTAGGWTVVVTGSARMTELRRLAASLRPR